MISHQCITDILSVMGWVILISMVFDVVEDSQKKTGSRDEGLFLAGPGLFQKVFSGHFNILAAASLVFAFDYLKSNNFEQLVQKNKHLGNTFRKELIDIGMTPAYHQRKDQSSIISIATDEEVLKQLEGQNIRASYRNKYLRFSVHFYNSSSEIDQLIGTIRKLIPT